MRTPAILLMSSAAMSFAALTAQSVKASEEGTWSDPAKGKLTIEGVCNITATEVGCWSYKGREDLALAARVKESLSNGLNEIQFVIGKKNRYVVANWDRKGLDPNLLEGQGYRSGHLGNNTLHPGKTLIAVPMDPDATDFSATINLNFQNRGHTFELAPRKGAVSTHGEQAVEVTEVAKIAPEATTSSMFRHLKLKQLWRIRVGAKNVRLNYIELANRLKTRDGVTIEFLDDNGNPGAKPVGPNLALRPRIALWIDPLSGDLSFETNVNPDKLQSISFTPSSPEDLKIEFNKIPADPKPDQEVGR